MVFAFLQKLRIPARPARDFHEILQNLKNSKIFDFGQFETNFHDNLQKSHLGWDFSEHALKTVRWKI